MTQEEKNLLLKDLCARLPYGVMYETSYGPRVLNDIFIYSNGPVYTDHGIGNYNEVYGIELENIKPYLRPMSSITKEEREELCELCEFFEPYNDRDDFSHYGIELIEEFCVNDEKIPLREINYKVLDWLNTHHFDYRGLIEKGLALKAPKDMYKTE